jgi:hypothetical protein
VLPGLLSTYVSPASASFAGNTPTVVISAMSLLLLVGGEMLERSLFFMAAASPKMPGSVGG